MGARTITVEPEDFPSLRVNLTEHAELGSWYGVHSDHPTELFFAPMLANDDLPRNEEVGEVAFDLIGEEDAEQLLQLRDALLASPAKEGKTVYQGADCSNLSSDGDSCGDCPECEAALAWLNEGSK